MELLVIASWTSYVVPSESIPGRMSPLVTTILALINTLINVSYKIPSSRSMTAFELWATMGLIQVNETKITVKLQVIF